MARVWLIGLAPPDKPTSCWKWEHWSMTRPVDTRRQGLSRAVMSRHGGLTLV